MLSLWARCNNWLSKHMFYVVLLGLVLGFVLPLPTKPVYHYLVLVLFAYMTFITALGTSFNKFIQAVTKPKIIIFMLILIHGVMPLIAWLVGFMFYPHNNAIRMGFLIAASIPIGVTSIIWTSVVKGDVALSLATVTVDTLLAPLLIPFVFLIMVGKAITIDYGEMITTLLCMITIPSLLGMFVNHFIKGRWTTISQSVGGVTSKLALTVVIYINVSTISPSVQWQASTIKLLLVILLMGVLGYSLGYLGSHLLRRRRPETVAAMVYNVGMRNTVFGVVLATAYFPPEVAVPVVLGMLYQQPIAGVLCYLLNNDYRRIPVES